MAEVLRDLSAEALVRAEEANLIALTPFNRGWPDAEYHRGDDLCWCFTNIPAVWCNTVFNARLEPERADAAIEMIMARGRARKVPVQWWVRQGNRPVDLGERLKAHGFMHSADAAGMAIDIDTIDDGGKFPEGLSIEKVRDTETLKTWCRITVTGFGLPPFAIASFHRWFTRELKEKRPLQFYLGLWRGHPVATSMSFCAEGVAGLYFIAVVEAARGRGIGTAMTLALLHEARRAGYRAATLQASSMGEPVYKKLGFREYSRIGSYIWLDPAQLMAGGG